MTDLTNDPDEAMREVRLNKMAMWPRPIAIAMSAHLIMHPYIDQLKWFEEQVAMRMQTLAAGAMDVKLELSSGGLG